MRSAALKTAPRTVLRMNFEWSPFGRSPWIVNVIGAKSLPARLVCARSVHSATTKNQTKTVKPMLRPWSTTQPHRTPELARQDIDQHQAKRGDWAGADRNDAPSFFA